MLIAACEMVATYPYIYTPTQSILSPTIEIKHTSVIDIYANYIFTCEYNSYMLT